MDNNKTQYDIELLCDYPEWWRYNVYIMAIGYDRDGGGMMFNNLTDKIYDSAYGGAKRTAPDGFKLPRVIRLLTEECAYIDLYVYVVTNTFPESEVISDSPSFDIRIKVTADAGPVFDREYEVNQWGGLTIVSQRVDAAS